MCAQIKIAKFLSPNWISELVWDSRSDKPEASSNSIHEGEGGFKDKPGVSPASIVLCKTRYPQERPKKIKFFLFSSRYFAR
jgi:hypothetical protein